jgi:hypothetical protein
MKMINDRGPAIYQHELTVRQIRALEAMSEKSIL